MNNWLQQLVSLCDEQQPCVLVTVAGTRGSTPRETGAKMIVTGSATLGTIGGGQLEYQCVQSACAWLREMPGTGRTKLQRFSLGANCGQCCGGVADILFEEITVAQHAWIRRLAEQSAAGTAAAMVTVAHDRERVLKWLVSSADWPESSPQNLAEPRLAQRRQREQAGLPAAVAAMAQRALEPGVTAFHDSVSLSEGKQHSVLVEPVRAAELQIAVFGAGHVGSACVRVLATLNARIHWIDSRAELLDTPCPPHVQVIHSDDPAAVVRHLPAACHYLVMTHDHALDFAICTQILARTEVAYCGLIGSRSKRRRFVKRLRAAGVTQMQCAQLICPIGVAPVSGKKPAEIAIAVAAQLLGLQETRVDAVASDARRRRPRFQAASTRRRELRAESVALARSGARTTAGGSPDDG